MPESKIALVSRQSKPTVVSEFVSQKFSVKKIASETTTAKTAEVHFEIQTAKKKQKSEKDPEYCRKLTTSVKKAKPLTMHDYKKFKLIKSIDTKYRIGAVLGTGAFGQVRRCTHLDTGTEFAIKIMKKEMVYKRKIYVKLLENELSILGSKSHPKIIRVVDLMEDEGNYYVVSELVEGGELFKRLQQLESFTEQQAVNII